MWPCYILQYSFPVSCVSDKRAPIIFYDTVSLQVVSVTNVHLLYSITQNLPASSVSDERAPVIFHITVSLQVVSVTNVHLLYSTTQSPCKLCQWRTCTCYILQHSLPASCLCSGSANFRRNRGIVRTFSPSRKRESFKHAHECFSELSTHSTVDEEVQGIWQ